VQLEREPDVILTDYRLPDERTAVDIVKATVYTLGTDIPTVVFTGEVADIKRHEELRGKTVLRKPVSPRNLVEEISRAAPKH